MWLFIVKRLFQAIPVLFLVITVTFFMVRAAPGGPFDAERAVPPEVLKQLNQRYHLDDPLWKQYLDYLWNVIQGDFGPSFKYPTHSVNDLIASGFPATLELSLYAIGFALLVGLSAGLLAALRRNTWQDYIPMSAAMIGICMPTFVLGPILLLIFGLWLGWLPVAGWGQIPGDKVLPSITLGTAYAAYIARICRGGMLEILSQDYIRTARAKGLSNQRIVLVHALRGGIAPVISYLGPALAGLLAGSFVVETIFQIPGLGRFYVTAAFNRDYTMILGCTIFFAFLIVLFNLLADIVLVWLNPKLRQELGGKR
ncbi:ABC transporter permease [Cellvibrio japonicus]|uniref:Oligopeptide transport system permease protein oppB n=1 Tax=Cellvibrio japonicus (strain Ueda107) TaxID=498211 RepID=B3PIB6_CELJU|nr:ABC transporter permease subunit [Cellvibrio japonicus]ACE84342.1 oligopeptide transport system permease protein oppB [Cellvibrio japonicus Ueda107]QEI12521.1 ABC transporter permease subunit [Cellvibrio japonicus]QEI16095.1 ABC transporter permease subunit [Cellvibrio japonicus]QEI19673.1 ABC transporter permease subunit [Cellvibrio japonicus]